MAHYRCCSATILFIQRIYKDISNREKYLALFGVLILVLCAGT